jgi:DNA polymerase-3 subunit alpha
MQDGDLTTQYAKDPVEKLGLLKMDFLGLKTLTVVDDAQKLVRKHRKLPKFNIEKVGFEDAKTFALLNDAKTVGFIVVTSDRGLAGGLNVNVFRALLKSLRDWKDKGVDTELALISLAPFFASSSHDKYDNAPVHHSRK